MGRVTDLLWIGPAPSVALARRLRDGGFALRRRPAGGPAAPTVGVVFTPSARRVPASPAAGLPWIWLCGRRVPAPAARSAVLDGAYDVVTLAEPDATTTLLARLAEMAVRDEIPEAEELVTVSAVSRRVLAQIARVAATSMPVLLTGETGTGKELAARLIHARSTRRTKPLVPINCAAIPNELMEAELFGYARGAFSGAVQNYDGQLAAAAGGTVFLDEIDDTPLSLQMKLLRVLEDHVVNRLGESTWRRVDFRILAATNRDLRPLIAAGSFGADLYERLAIVTIDLPPLRERLDDLPGLVQQLIARFYREEPRPGPRVRGVRADALAALTAYPWPGNIRELRNVLWETLVYKRTGEEIILSDLPRRVLAGRPDHGEWSLVDPSAVARRIAAGTLKLRDEIAALERIALTEAFARARGNAARAAELLGTVGRGAARNPGATVRAMARRLGVAGRASRR
jgi:transcriptional regulator with PAS, ATPase and Fis domain